VIRDLEVPGFKPGPDFILSRLEVHLGFDAGGFGDSCSNCPDRPGSLLAEPVSADLALGGRRHTALKSWFRIENIGCNIHAVGGEIRAQSPHDADALSFVKHEQPGAGVRSSGGTLLGSGQGDGRP
jgi:hypothetical protein